MLSDIYCIMINDEEYDDDDDANTKEEEIVLSRCLSNVSLFLVKPSLSDIYILHND